VLLGLKGPGSNQPCRTSSLAESESHGDDAAAHTRIAKDFPDASGGLEMLGGKPPLCPCCSSIGVALSQLESPV